MNSKLLQDLVFPDYLLKFTNSSDDDDKRNYAIKIRLEFDPIIWKSSNSNNNNNHQDIIIQAGTRLQKVLGLLVSSFVGVILSSSTNDNNNYGSSSSSSSSMWTIFCRTGKDQEVPTSSSSTINCNFNSWLSHSRPSSTSDSSSSASTDPTELFSNLVRDIDFLLTDQCGCVLTQLLSKMFSNISSSASKSITIEKLRSIFNHQSTRCSSNKTVDDHSIMTMTCLLVIGMFTSSRNNFVSAPEILQKTISPFFLASSSFPLQTLFFLYFSKEREILTSFETRKLLNELFEQCYHNDNDDGFNMEQKRRQRSDDTREEDDHFDSNQPSQKGRALSSFRRRFSLLRLFSHLLVKNCNPTNNFTTSFMKLMMMNLQQNKEFPTFCFGKKNEIIKDLTIFSSLDLHNDNLMMLEDGNDDHDDQNVISIPRGFTAKLSACSLSIPSKMLMISSANKEQEVTTPSSTSILTTFPFVLMHVTIFKPSAKQLQAFLFSSKSQQLNEFNFLHGNGGGGNTTSSSFDTSKSDQQQEQQQQQIQDLKLIRVSFYGMHNNSESLLFANSQIKNTTKFFSADDDEDEGIIVSSKFMKPIPHLTVEFYNREAVEILEKKILFSSFVHVVPDVFVSKPDVHFVSSFFQQKNNATNDHNNNNEKIVLLAVSKNLLLEQGERSAPSSVLFHSLIAQRLRSECDLGDDEIMRSQHRKDQILSSSSSSFDSVAITYKMFHDKLTNLNDLEWILKNVCCCCCDDDEENSLIKQRKRKMMMMKWGKERVEFLIRRAIVNLEMNKILQLNISVKSSSSRNLNNSTEVDANADLPFQNICCEVEEKRTDEICRKVTEGLKRFLLEE